MPDKVTRSLNCVVLAASTASFLLIKRVSRDIDRTNNVSVRVESAFAFVPTVLRLVLHSADGTPLRRFVRVHVDQMNARQSRLVRYVFRESIKTPRVERTIVLPSCRNLLL